MADTAQPVLAPDIAAALADDAETLAQIHDRELGAAVVEELKAIGFPDNLALRPAGAGALEAWRFMATALRDLAARPDPADLDRLAADFASIYLTAAYGASPCESTWTDDDHLVCQDSMFQLREIYEAAGVAAADWRRRPDDHLVLQLAFLARSMRRAATRADWRALATVMDDHLLRWLPEFSRRIAGRCATPFYAGLAMVTHEWCDALRDLLAGRLGEPRPSPKEVELRMKPPARDTGIPVAFVPGLGPSV